MCFFGTERQLVPGDPSEAKAMNSDGAEGSSQRCGDTRRSELAVLVRLVGGELLGLVYVVVALVRVADRVHVVDLGGRAAERVVSHGELDGSM